MRIINDVTNEGLKLGFAVAVVVMFLAALITDDAVVASYASKFKDDSIIIVDDNVKECVSGLITTTLSATHITYVDLSDVERCLRLK